MLFNNWWYYMQVKTFKNDGPAPVPIPSPTPDPYPGGGDPNTGMNIAAGTRNMSTVKPVFLTELHPVHNTVMQNFVKAPDGQFFMSQTDSGTNGARTPFESTYISRMNAAGVLQDSMLLQNGGHGTSFGIEQVSGNTFITMTYQQDTALSQTASNDIVRFKYQTGTYNRNTLPSLTVMPKMDSGYTIYSFDFAADSMVSRSSGRTYKWRKISEWKAGTNHVYMQWDLQEGPPVFQGFTPINQTMFRWMGSNTTVTPPDLFLLQQYNMAQNAQEMDAVFYTGLGKDANGTFYGGQAEPEGASTYRDPTTHMASLLIGVTTGGPGIHKYQTFSFPNIGVAA